MGASSRFSKESLDRFATFVGSFGLVEPDLITVSEAARILAVSDSAVRRACDSGQLGHRLTPGGHRRIVRSDVEALAVMATPEEAA